MSPINQIVSAWNDLNLLLVLGIFFAYMIVDGLYATYTLHVTQYREYSSATIGALMHFILAFGVLNYIHNFLYVIPLAAGSWFGTFIVVRNERLTHARDTE